MNKIADTFIELLNSVDLEEVYTFLYNYHKEISPDEVHDFVGCKSSYSKIIESLRAKSPPQETVYPIVVLLEQDVLFSDETYIDVRLINTNYNSESSNIEESSEYFGFGWGKWETIAHAPVFINNVDLKNYEIAAHILWELTFYGFNEQDQDDFFNKIMSNDPS